MKSHVVIASAGKDIETTFQVIRTFPTERVILLSDKEDLEAAKESQKDFEKFKIPVKIIEIKNYSMEEIFRIIKLIAGSEKNKEIIINVSSGNKVASCLTLCAAYVHGIKAAGVMKDKVILLPIMKFSYYKMLSDQKLRIMKLLDEKQDCCASLENLSKEMKMSLPLISYHINGNLKSEGLKDMGLIETKEAKGKIAVTLSTLGRLLLKGYVSA